MFKTLVWIRLKAFADSLMNRRGKKDGGKGRKAVLILLFAYVFIVFGFMFGGLFYSMYAPFSQLGLGWLYYSMAALLSTMLCFVGSVFFAQSTLYEAKDNELLMAMPVSPAAILASRMMLLVLINYAYSLLIMIPCGVVRCIMAPVSAAGVVRFLICALLLPLLPTALSSAFGWILALIISRVRNRSLFSLLISLAFLGAYFVVCFNLQGYIESMIANGAAIGTAVRKAMPPFYSMGLALDTPDWLQLMRFVLWCLVPFGSVLYILSRNYVRLATGKKGERRVTYTPGRLQAASPLRAMIGKELRRLGSSSTYMLNGCLGAVLCVAVAVITLVKGEQLLQTLTNIYAGGLDVSKYVMPVACVVECLTLSMNVISAPSVSLEGKNLWILKSAPVSAADVLRSKALVHLMVCGPAALIASVCFALALPMSGGEILILFLLPLLLTAFMAQLGVAVNLRWPRLDYASEAAVVKQSASVAVTMFSGMGIVILPVLLYVLLLKSVMSITVLLVLFAGLLALGNAVLYHYITHGAEKVFANLDRE